MVNLPSKQQTQGCWRGSTFILLTLSLWRLSHITYYCNATKCFACCFIWFMCLNTPGRHVKIAVSSLKRCSKAEQWKEVIVLQIEVAKTSKVPQKRWFVKGIGQNLLGWASVDFTSKMWIKLFFFVQYNTAAAAAIASNCFELNCFDHHYFNGAFDALKQPQLHFHLSSILKTLNNSQKVIEHKGIRYKLYRGTAEQLLRKRLAGIPSSSDIDVLLRLHPDTQGFNEPPFQMTWTAGCLPCAGFFLRNSGELEA